VTRGRLGRERGGGAQGCWPSGGYQMGHERLQVGPGGGLQASAAAAQEGVGLPYRDEMGRDGAGRADLGVPVPLEGAEERVAAGRVHEAVLRVTPMTWAAWGTRSGPR
jgi:hypothetical protein